jgi:tetratricopeptide (TPR) repeat protein
MNQNMMNLRIPEGQKTKTIYNLINDRKYTQAIKLLNQELQFCQKSRVISLLGYCHYMSGDFESAASIYEELTFLYPENQNYKVTLKNTSYIIYKNYFNFLNKSFPVPKASTKMAIMKTP